MAFIEAERTRLYLRCALFGPSGSGKTMTALRMAKGIAEKMGCRYAVIDTESRSASKYADRFRFVVNDLENKTVDGYIQAMNEAYEAGYKMLVIDSLSHAWRELLDEVDRLKQNGGNKNALSPWAKANPKQKRFIEAVLRYPGHIIATMRSNTEWVVSVGSNGKQIPEKMGLAPEQGKGIEYEFDLLVELNQQHQAVVTKDRTGKFQDETIDKPGEEFGVTLYNWLASESAVTANEAKPAAAPSHPTVPPAVNPDANVKPETEQDDVKAAAQTVPAKREAAIAPQNTSVAEIDTVLREIADVITCADENGKPYFSEVEKDDARQLISGVPRDGKGVKELREFKALLTDLLAGRKQAALVKHAA